MGRRSRAPTTIRRGARPSVMNASAVKAQRARWRERLGIVNLGVISPSNTLRITMGRSALLEFERNPSDQIPGLTGRHLRRRRAGRAPVSADQAR